MFFGGSHEAHAASAPTKVVIAYATISERITPLWIAQEQGFFAKYGIKAELIFVRSAPILMAGLASGDIHIGTTGGNPALSAAAGGLDFKIVANFASRARADLVARPGIKSPEDLRGKRLGVQSIGGTVWMYALLGLEHLRLDPDKDNIRILVVGEQAILSQALVSGTIDATVFSSRGFSRALKEKEFPVLAQLRLPVAGLSIVVKKSFMQQQLEALENVLKAQIEGLAFALSPSNKVPVLETIMRRLKISNPALANESYKDFFEDLDRKPYPSVEGLQNIQRLMKTRNPRIAEINVKDFIDERFIRKLDESGFIDRLYNAHQVK
jgi:NitT/TauT family transport system substrate-binding protein